MVLKAPIYDNSLDQDIEQSASFVSVAAMKTRKMDEMRPAQFGKFGISHPQRERERERGRRDLKEGGGGARARAGFASLTTFPTNFVLSDVG